MEMLTGAFPQTGCSSMSLVTMQGWWFWQGKVGKLHRPGGNQRAISSQGMPIAYANGPQPMFGSSQAQVPSIQLANKTCHGLSAIYVQRSDCPAFVVWTAGGFWFCLQLELVGLTVGEVPALVDYAQC